MCVGMAVLFGPPTTCLGCYWVHSRGQATAHWYLQRVPAFTWWSATTGAGAIAAAYTAQLRSVVRHFEPGGALALDYRNVQALGRPGEISTWGQFWRLTGPPVAARVGALLVSCYVGGVAHACAGAASSPADVRSLSRRE